MKPRHAAALALKKPSLPSWVLLGCLFTPLLAGIFLIQACASNHTNSPVSAATAPLLCVQDAVCFKQSLDADHVALPAGVTTEQAYANYKSCMLQSDQTMGPFFVGGAESQVVHRNCFTRVFQ